MVSGQTSQLTALHTQNVVQFYSKKTYAEFFLSPTTSVTVIGCSWLIIQSVRGGGHHGYTSDNTVVILSHPPEHLWRFSSTFAIHLALHFPFDSDSGMSTD